MSEPIWANSRLLRLASQSPVSRAHVEPDIAATAAGIGQDAPSGAPKSAASPGGATSAGILDRIGEGIAAVIAGRAGNRLHAGHAFLDQLLGHLVGHVGGRMLA